MRIFRNRFALILLGILCVALLPLQTQAQERILAYDSTLDIHADGSLDVTEHITVRAEGKQIRRGIYRDFPTRYKDRHGNRIVVDLQVESVLRDGQPEPWFIERRANGVRINTGNDDSLPLPATYTYTLHYRTTRQMGFFADHDELYWNAIGTGWIFPIEHATVQANLPQPVPIDQLSAEAYTGAQGQQGQDYRADINAPGSAHWVLTRPLMPNEGMTVVLGFPKGIISEPGLLQRLIWLLDDNQGVLVALLGLLALIVVCVRRWNAIGRDPRAGVIIPRYEPPSDYTPGELRYMHKSGYDNRCFSSDLLALAVAGWIRIQGQDKAAGIKEWRLQRLPDPVPGSIDDGQQAMLKKLFSTSADELVLRNTNAPLLMAAQSERQATLLKRFQPALINFNRRSLIVPVLIAIGSGVLAFVISGGSGIPLIIGLCVLMFIVLLGFGKLVEAPTPAGRRLLDEIEGLRLYLGVAERDEIKRMPGLDAAPVLDAERYEKLLPYAVALDVENAWTTKFTVAVGAAAAAAAVSGMAWYRGSDLSGAGNFSKALGSSLNAQIASSSSPPGSSSGSGGGGSSGGGGGGGGGGGR